MRSYICFFVMVLMLQGCVVKPVIGPTIPEMKRVETLSLPPTPESMPIPAQIAQEGNWVVPLEMGECVSSSGLVAPQTSKPCPSKSGLFESEEHAVRDQQYRTSYQELRKLYESDQKVWSAQRDLYEGTIKEQSDQIQKLQPTWYQQNALALGAFGGFLLGITTAGVVLYLSK